jgi:pyridoxal phosphate enzyme (YggS family)
MLPPTQTSSSSSELAHRLQEVRNAIAAATRTAGRDERAVTLVAVSKGHQAELISAAARLGITDFGENYLQEALPKIAAVREAGLVWHFLGRLQANKTRPVAEYFDWVHGLDRLRIAERLSQQRSHLAPPLNVCLQVNIAQDDKKAGVAPADVAPLAAAVASLPHLRLRGLMCMLPEGLDTPARRGAYAQLRQLLVTLRTSHPELDTLSMGMSGDFSDAILEGATIVRVGTAIFGPRDYSHI